MILRSECDKCMGRGWYEGYEVSQTPISDPVAVNRSFKIIQKPCSCTPNNRRRVKSAREEYEQRKAIAFDTEGIKES